jgi:hypothetical protein
MATTKISNSGLVGTKYENLSADNNYMETIASSVVGAGGASSITFSNIPQGYKHLQIRGISRLSGSATNQGVYAKFNGSSLGYSYLGGHVMYGNGSTTSSINGWQGTSIAGGVVSQIPAATATANIFGTNVTDILDYTNTNKYKTVRTINGFDTSSIGQVHLMSFVWLDTSPITTILILPDSSYVQYSRISLYGIKG